MTQVLLCIGLFSIVLGGSLWVQKRGVWLYHTKPLLYTGWYSFWILIIALYSQQPVTMVHVGSVCGVILVFVSLIWLWQRLTGGQLRFAASIPLPAFTAITTPTIPAQVPKALEVLLQDISAWLLVGSLFSFGYTLHEIQFWFTLIVALVHAPGVRIFGWWYGGYFFAMATLFAFVVPLAFAYDLWGLLFVFGLHLTGYVLMHLFFREKQISH